jgi:hypothetical protein
LRDVHEPSAHLSPSDPQLFPFAANTSAGHIPLEPVHVSAVSHVASFAARQTVVLDANWHEPVQHSSFDESHTAPVANLHEDVQHVELMPDPGSQSSPFSTMPLPHWLSEIVRCPALGVTKQDVFIIPPPMREPVHASVLMQDLRWDGTDRCFPAYTARKCFPSPPPPDS